MIAIAVGLVLLTFYVLGALGLVIPEIVRTIVMIVVGLLVLLYLWRAFGSSLRL